MTSLVATAPIALANLRLTSPDKLLPVAVSQIFNTLTSPQTSGLVLWNTGNAKPGIDSETNKNQILTSHGINPATIAQGYDNDPDFHHWAVLRIDRALSRGYLQIGLKEVMACSSCHGALTLAVAGHAPEKCAGCKSTAPSEGGTAKVLTLPLAHSAAELATACHIFNRPANWEGQLASMPGEMLISKPRETGISLEALGLKGLKLDPRVSNALFPLYEAEKRGASEAWSVVDVTILNLVAPFIHGFRGQPLPSANFMGISRMPVSESLANDTITSRLDKPDIFSMLSLLSLSGQNWSNYEARRPELETFARRLSRTQGYGTELKLIMQDSFSQAAGRLPKFLKACPELVKRKGPNCSV